MKSPYLRFGQGAAGQENLYEVIMSVMMFFSQLFLLFHWGYTHKKQKTKNKKKPINTINFVTVFQIIYTLRTEKEYKMLKSVISVISLAVRFKMPVAFGLDRKSNFQGLESIFFF